MRSFRFIKLLFLLISAALGAALLPAASLPRFEDDLPPGVLADRILDSMTDAEALGQVLMFGYRSEEADPAILAWIENQGLGGVKVFGRNANNLDMLAEAVSEYQETALEGRFGIPLLIATDQEGGWVRHIRGTSSQTPGNMALGAGGLPYDAWMTGKLLGEELAAVGVNMNFAPTIDVFVDPEADVIGPRAFMDDPVQTGILGLAFTRGHEESRVISTAKHFPGHGDTADDSHGTLPKVYADLDTLRSRDLVPYRTMITGGVPAIMVGHLAFPTITGDEVPATLSKALLTDLLRDELGFDGVAITDDLFMQGARADGASMDEVCYRAMLAGADILLVSQNPSDHRAIHRRLSREMELDAAFTERVREAARRVLVLKAHYLKDEGAVPFKPDDALAAIPADGADAYFLSQSAASITLVRGGRCPLPPEDAGSVLLAGASYMDFFNRGVDRYPQAKTWRLEYMETKAGLQRKGRELRRAAENYETVIVLVTDAETAIILNELEPIAEKVIVISALSPAHLDSLSWAETSLAAYGTGSDSFKAVFAALAGDFQPTGMLPIPLETAP